MSPKRRLSLLLSSTLETLAHQILYARHVYPRETFGAAQFLGVRCRANRCPSVVRYVHDSVELAVPALLSGAADEVQIVICEADELGSAYRELETYRLRFQGLVSGPDEDEDDGGVYEDEEGDDDDDIRQAIQNEERSVRDLMIRVLGMESGSPSRSDSLSFRIMFHVADKDATCPELDRAFAAGSCVSIEKSTTKNEGRVIRPLYQATFGSASLSLHQLVRSKTSPKHHESAVPESSQVLDFDT